MVSWGHMILEAKPVRERQSEREKSGGQTEDDRERYRKIYRD